MTTTARIRYRAGAALALSVALALSACTSHVAGLPGMATPGTGSATTSSGTVPGTAGPGIEPDGPDAQQAAADDDVVGPQRQEGTAGTVIAPGRVGTSAAFDVTLEFRADQLSTDASVTVHLPTEGALLAAPERFETDAGTLTGTVPSGAPVTATIRWYAPAAPTVLTVTVEIDAADLHDQLGADIEVVAGVGATLPIDYANLHRYLAGATLPTNPDDLHAECFAFEPLPIPTLEEAIADMQDWIAEEMPAGPTDWSGDPLYRDSEGLKTAFVEAYLAGSVEMMLVLALRGHQLDPGDGAHLLNAGTAANLLEEPETALAFLQAAAALPLGASDGMPQRAVLLNNTADAHAMRGDWDRAVALLEQALQVDPGNPLLERQLAENLVCAGRKAEALDHLRAGYRDDDDPDGVVIDAATVPVSRPDADLLVDTSPALAFPLQPATVPTSWESLLGATAGAKAALSAATADQQTLRARYDTLWHEFLNDDASAPAAHRRQAQLLLTVGSAQASAALQEAEHGLLAASRDLETWCADNQACDSSGQVPYTGVPSQDLPSCADHRAAFAAWRVEADDYLALLNDYYYAAWPVWTAVQGNLADPRTSELATLQLEIADAQYRIDAASVVADAGTIFTLLNGLARELESPETCTNPLPPEHDGDRKPAKAAPACTGALASQALAVSLKIFSVKISCDTIALEVSTEAPFLKGFAQWELGMSPGGRIRSSLVVGSKLDLGLELIDNRAETSLGLASFQSALYIAYDPDRQITDMGWVVGPEMELAAGPGRLKVADDKMKMSVLTVSGAMDIWQ